MKAEQLIKARAEEKTALRLALDEAERNVRKSARAILPAATKNYGTIRHYVAAIKEATSELTIKISEYESAAETYANYKA